MENSFILDEFTTGAWSERDEYASDRISWDHVVRLHQAEPDFTEVGKCGDNEFYYFLHLKGGYSFEMYIYSISGWLEDNQPYQAEPLIWIYGTTFDGVREESGGQNFSVNLLSMAKCLVWIHEYCCKRWPRFAEWYSDIPR